LTHSKLNSKAHFKQPYLKERQLGTFFNEWGVIAPFKSNDESMKFVRFETMRREQEE